MADPTPRALNMHCPGSHAAPETFLGAGRGECPICHSSVRINKTKGLLRAHVVPRGTPVSRWFGKPAQPQQKLDVTKVDDTPVLRVRDGFIS